MVFFTSYSNQSRDDRSQAKVETPPIVKSPTKENTTREVSSLNRDIKTLVKTRDRRGLEEKLAQRKTRIKKLMAEDPASALAQTLEGKKLRDELPNELKNQVEVETAVEGKLGVAVLDDFKNKSAEYEYSVVKNDKTRVDLHFLKDAPKFKPGSKIRTKGFAIDDQLLVTPTDKEFELISENTNVLGESTPIRVAVILINFQDQPVKPYTPESARQATFTGPDSANIFYQESSHGKYRLEGDVYGWYTLPYANTGCNLGEWGFSAKEMAAADGFNINNYDVIIHGMPSTSCGFGGYAFMGDAPHDVFMNGGYVTAVIDHEIGHTLGLMHANGLNCYDQTGQRVSSSFDCRTNEYEDPFDVMGAPYGAYHFSVFFKSKIHFSESTNLQKVTTNGEFDLAANEITTPALKSIFIPFSKKYGSNDEEGFYLEFRRRLGIFDQFLDPQYNLDGVAIRRAYDSTLPYANSTGLVDTTPETLGFWDAPLGVGKTLIERLEGISITTLAITDTTARVKVEFLPEKCIRAPATVTISPEQATAAPGESIQYYLYVKNNDSELCGSSYFSIYFSMPDGLSVPNSYVPMYLMPGQYSNISFKVAVNSSVAPGIYPLTQTAYQIGSYESVNATSNLEIIDPTISPTTIPTSTLTPSPSLAPTCVTHASGKRADFNDDGKVDLMDYSILLSELLKSLTVYRADANCDLKVDLNDYSIFLSEVLK